MIAEIIQTAIIGLSLGAQYALIALGFTLIFGILGVVNFAHGGFYMLGGYFAYAAVSALHLPYAVAVVAAVLGTGLLGYVFEIVCIERLVQDELSTLMLTLGLYMVMSTAVLAIWGPTSPEFVFPLNGSFDFDGVYVRTANLVVFSICFAVTLALYVFIYKTDFGRAVRALADNRRIAIAQGIRPHLLFPMIFALATGLAGLTGALVTPILFLSPDVGNPTLVTSFLVVILGGLGDLVGATLAAFLVGFVQSYSDVYIGSSNGSLALFLIVLVVLAVRPNGLRGKVTRGA